MLKTLSKILPLLDHLYIFQILEYDVPAFLKWFLKYPLVRNLQRKHQLEWTVKIKLLFTLTLFWIAVSVYLLGFPLTLLTVILLSPLFIFLSYLSFLPLEIYYKNKIMVKAKKRLDSLPNLKIIAITGSYGKTSTKDMLYTLLWKKFRAVKTPKSFNTPLGLAQTILDYLKPNTEIFIAEIGAYKLGDIKKLTQFLKPDIGVITAIGPQHLERFGSMENIRKAKMELVENLPASRQGGPENGTAILKFKKFDIDLPFAGEHHQQNFAAAATVAMQLGMTLQGIKERVQWLQPTPHRLEVKKQGSLTIIDNTYNTNPVSAKTSLKLLQETSGTQKILITPGLVELGSEHELQNREFAKNASRVADEIIIVGEFAKKALLQGLKNFPPQKIHTEPTLNDAMNLLTQIAKPNAVVLLENDLPDHYF